MKYRKVIPFKLKNLLPMAVVAGSTIFFGACHKKPVPEPPHHNTTYIWGIYNTKDVLPADNITKSVDSTSVDFVFLENDGVSWEGTSPTIALRYVQKILDDVKSDKKHKIRGAGTINGVGMSRSNENHYRDSIALAQMGFKFNNVRHVK